MRNVRSIEAYVALDQLKKKSEVVMALSHYSAVALPALLMVLEALLKLTNTTVFC